MHIQRDYAVEPEQHRLGPEDRGVRPLALRFHPEMRVRLLISGLNSPPPVKAVQHVAWGGAGVRAQKSFRLTPAVGVADQHPQDWHNRLAPVMPQRRAGGIFNSARAAPGGPAGLHDPQPARGRVGNARGQQHLARAFAGGTAGLVLVVRWRVEQARIFAHLRDDRHGRAKRVQQFQRGDLAVYDRHDGPVRQPAPQGQQHHAGPLGHGSMALPLALRPCLARDQGSQ